jgi:hypothetical protein
MSEPPASRRTRERRSYERGQRQLRQEITLSLSEQALIREKAARLGVSVPRLMVDATLADVVSRPERLVTIAALHRFNRLLANLTANVNQLAHQANVAGQVLGVDEVEQALVAIAELRDQADATLARVG